MANNEKNTSSIEKAVVELQAIVENAEKSAKDKLAKQLPEKFETLIKEELENINNKKESVKESVKDVTKEPVNEGKKTDDDKESLNEMEEIDLSELSIEDIEEAYNEASATDEFEVTPDEINIDDIESELEEMQGMTAEIDMQQEGDNPSDPFDQIKNLHKMLGEMIQDNETTNEMHDKVPRGATAPADKGHNTTSAGINETDINEAIDPVAIGALAAPLALAIGALGVAGVKAALKKYSPKGAEVLDKLSTSSVRDASGGHSSAMGEGEEMLDENLDPMVLQTIAGGLGLVGAIGGSVALEDVLKKKYPKAYEALKSAAASAGSSIQGGTTSMGEGMVSESESEEKEEVIDEVDAASEEKEEVDEKHGVGYSDGKVRAGTLPNQGAEYRDRKGHSRNRPAWSNESVEKFKSQKESMEKRMTSLIEENKKMTKKLNESKAEQKKYNNLLEEQAKIKNTLVKYRDQLSEMAIFNTNLFGVNRILVNEDLALTSEDKKMIVDKFKNVKSITESEETYKKVLNEMQEAKKTITESVEDKVNDSIDKSSSEKVVEQTAYVNEHVNKIKNLMKYVDNHGNKKILS